MRGIYTPVTDIRRKVFTEVARMAYSGNGYEGAENLPFKIVPGDQPLHRESIFLERAIAGERVRLAMGLSIRPIQTRSLMTEGMDAAAIAEQYYEAPLVNIIPYACHACPTKRYSVTNICQGCLAASCQSVCPKGAISFANGKSVIDETICIRCGKCASACSYHAIAFIERPCQAACGMDAIGSDEHGKAVIHQDKCVACGQCLVSCPFGAIVDKGQIFQVVRSILQGDQVVAIVAPAFVGQFSGMVSPGKFVTAMKQLGFDRVVEVAVGADVCTVEEAKDFLEKVPSQQDYMATSCCPAWIRFAETRHPEILENISTCRSPMEMFGSVIKEYFGNCGKRVVSVAIMPCTAKKFEAMRDEFRDKNGTPYVDYVITSQEIIQMIRQSGIRFDELEPEAVSMPFGMSSGAGLIFGASGGVTEAVLRRLSDDKSAGAIRSIANSGVRDIAGLKECSITHNGEEIKIAIVSGLENTDKLIHRIEEGEVSYHMVEVMACPGGCVSGAGQPFAKSGERRQRSESLYRNDRMCLIRRSEENPLMEELYSGILKDRTHELLHVDYVK